MKYTGRRDNDFNIHAYTCRCFSRRRSATASGHRRSRTVSARGSRSTRRLYQHGEEPLIENKGAVRGSPPGRPRPCALDPTARLRPAASTASPSATAVPDLSAPPGRRHRDTEHSGDVESEDRVQSIKVEMRPEMGQQRQRIRAEGHRVHGIGYRERIDTGQPSRDRCRRGSHRDGRLGRPRDGWHGSHKKSS